MNYINYEEYEEKMLLNREQNSFYQNVIITLKEQNKLLKKEAVRILNPQFETEYFVLAKIGELKYQVLKESDLFKKSYFLNNNIFVSKQEHFKYLDKALTVVIDNTLKKYRKHKI